LKLEGKKAIVTGSSKGIGAAIALAFAKQGAKVVVNYHRHRSDALRVVDEIKSDGGSAFAVKADVSVPEQVNSLFSESQNHFSGLDILVNNAGLADAKIWNSPLGRISHEMWQKVFALDVFGAFLCSQAAAQIMRRSGGRIINISSTPAVAGDKEGLVYASGKGAVLAMTKVLAAMLAPKIAVNCMVLGSIETSWVDWLSDARVDELKHSIPLKRFGKPGDVANLAVFLASNDSDYITGQGIIIDGGEVMR
jgi:3-oxoacyl-[acyl-carrier protein] reductase